MHTSLVDRDDQPAQLRVEDVSAGYGASLVIQDVNVTVRRGDIVGIIGPNGAGKSTLLKAITGVIPINNGRVLLKEQDITRLRADEIAREGVGYVPQVRNVFPRLTVGENLEMGGYTLPGHQLDERKSEVIEVFPLLGGMIDRVAANLSGGEAKMVAIGLVLMTRPSVLLLDEPTANLSPNVAAEFLQELVTSLAASGVAVLVVEQRAMEVLAVSTWAYVMRAGMIHVSQAAPELRVRDDIGQLYLGALQ